MSKDIHLIDGKVRIKLESGIQSGKTLRLRNKGIPDLNGYSKGDLLVHVNIWTPKTLNKKQKDFLKKCWMMIILDQILTKQTSPF